MARSSKQDRPPAPVKPDMKAMLKELGPRPPRRRPAMAWDKAVLKLADPYGPWIEKMGAAGYCHKCEKYFGKALTLHKRKCSK